MTDKELLLAIESEPFASIAIHMTDGATYPITRVGQMAVASGKSAIAVDGHIRIVSNDNITRVTPRISGMAT